MLRACILNEPLAILASSRSARTIPPLKPLPHGLLSLNGKDQVASRFSFCSQIPPAGDALGPSAAAARICAQAAEYAGGRSVRVPAGTAAYSELFG